MYIILYMYIYMYCMYIYKIQIFAKVTLKQKPKTNIIFNYKKRKGVSKMEKTKTRNLLNCFDSENTNISICINEIELKTLIENVKI